MNAARSSALRFGSFRKVIQQNALESNPLSSAIVAKCSQGIGDVFAMNFYCFALSSTRSIHRCALLANLHGTVHNLKCSDLARPSSRYTGGDEHKVAENIRKCRVLIGSRSYCHFIGVSSAPRRYDLERLVQEYSTTHARMMRDSYDFYVFPLRFSLRTFFSHNASSTR